jgi:chromosome segregation ATPase
MRKTIRLIVLAGVATALGGCEGLIERVQATAAPEPAKAADGAEYIDTASVKSEEEGDGSTAVQSALVWSEKYSQAVEKIVELQNANRQGEQEARQQQNANAMLKAELAQCQKELNDANSMLMEMQGELDQWKKNVLGFRQEMRDAQEAELVALRKVLGLLGGDLPESDLLAGMPPAAAPEQAQ